MVAYNFVQKYARIAEISTEVTKGYLFNVHPVYVAALYHQLA